MVCTKVREQLGVYADGELSEIETAMVEKHLSGCDDCRRELGEYYKLSTFVKGAYSATVEVDFSSSIMRKIKAEDPGSLIKTEAVKNRKIVSLKPFIAAAAMFAVVAGATVMKTGLTSPAVAEAEVLETYVMQHLSADMSTDLRAPEYVLVSE